MPGPAKLIYSHIILILFLLLTGCTIVPTTIPERDDLPPILAQDELLRPYESIGRIQIIREVYFSDYAVDPNLQEWGIKVLREEARKMKADALILPEVTSRKLAIMVFPTFPATEYRATGVAIKFK